MNSGIHLPFDNSYARLGERFYTRQLPVPVSNPGLIRVNHALARQLGLDPHWLESEQGVAFIAGNHIAEGSEPLAAVYAGHQFGGWNPQLGDGRAILLGEVIGRDGVRYDIQLKGSGRTPYSRGGDGRAPLGPVLREYIVSEAMAVLGVPTSRALGAVTSGEWVMREGRLPGAVLARVAQSHIRIGTFQFFAARRDNEALKTLIDHVIQRHYPQAAQAANPVRSMLDGVVARQASLIARWQSLGFIHGVMNTDNMLLSGETIDYGPCAFMDEFDTGRVLSSIDHGGRYAYGNQPYIAHWNLSVLTQALLPFLDENPDKALASGQAAIDAFPGLYQAAYLDDMRKKLGLAQKADEDAELIQDLLKLMQEEKADFTLTFRHLSDQVDPGKASGGGVGALIALPEAFAPWLARWQQRLGVEPLDATKRQQAMYAVNPVYIPRNHLVEAAISAAEKQSDFGAFNRLVDILANPFEYDPANAVYASPPLPEQVVVQTFCGT
ncbi:MAG TPA: YdiU family protein [Xanthomonadales bacterium]